MDDMLSKDVTRQNSNTSALTYVPRSVVDVRKLKGE